MGTIVPSFSGFQSLAVPEAKTETLVGSPRESLVGAFKRIIEPRKQGESVVASTMTESSTDHEESETIVESMGRGVKKESAKMNISM